ncbi:MAG TPA: DUF3800 domain-containing protein [Candidatus Margulisiibacteriota bacterium]|nr:DUF3800 domain-containing protein [Candidatus Margulisiibacteriota bacterium]
MYLLYLDESGNEDNPADRHFVLGGAAVFERVTFHLASALDALQQRHFPNSPPIEWHASAMRAGKGFWRGVQEQEREDLIREICEAIRDANPQGMVLFAAIVEKDAQLWGESAVEHATEQVCNRFDHFLRRHRPGGSDPQRGLLIFSEGRFDKRAKVWVREFRQLGTQWGILKNLADVPYFASMKETRLLQLADFVAYAVWLLYEKRDASLIRHFLHRFDQNDGVIHGLAHYRKNLRVMCDCPACASRITPGSLGSWLAAAPYP